MAPFKKIFGLGKSTQEISSTDAAQRHEKNEGSKLSTSVKTYRSTHVCLDCKKVTKLDLHVQLQKGGFVDGKVHFEQEAERGDTTCVLTIKTADTPAPPISESGFVRDPQHRALYAFLGQSTNEMTLKKGDFVTLLQKGSAGKLKLSSCIDKSDELP